MASDVAFTIAKNYGLVPYFDSFNNFVAMGGHGSYVWSCWGIVFGSLLLLIIFSLRQRKDTIHHIILKNKQQQKRKLS